MCYIVVICSKLWKIFFFFFFRGYSINTCNGFSFKKGKKNEAL